MSPVRHYTKEIKGDMSDGMRVLVVAEASGGHIYPALSFLDTLKDKYKTIVSLLVLPSRSAKLKILPNSCKIEYLSISPIELRFDFKNFIAILRFLKGSLESLVLLLKFRPDVVVGFGGISCVPLILFAWMTRTKTLIHEQNVIPGRANRLLTKFSDKVAISFVKTKDYLEINQKRIVLTGNPIRRELKKINKADALNFFGFNDDRFTILVMGGSHGSHKINMCFLGAISMLPDVSRLQFIHITGEEDYRLLDKSYKDLKLEIKLYSFLKDMQYAYSICDLAISRAGATTIAELINFTPPAIIIPYPFAYEHQLSNAKVLQNLGSAIIINDNELNAALLKKVIESLVCNPDKLKNMRSGYESITKAWAYTDESLVNEVVSLQNEPR